MSASDAYQAKRDLIGYGPQPPAAGWPNGARIAVQFVINYEEGGENCVLHGDTHSESFLSEIVGAQPFKNTRHMNMESIYEYGARAGFWRLHRAFTSRQIPVTVFGVALALIKNPGAVAAMQEAGWEIASHGLRWIDYSFMPPQQERAHIAEAIALHTRATGQPPQGWYIGRTSPNSRRLLLEAAAPDTPWLYDADSYADDLPYWLKYSGGDDKEAVPHLVVPYTLDANDMRFATPQGFNCGEQFYTYLKDSFDTLYAEGSPGGGGQHGAPKMLSVGLHCRLVGRPGRAAALTRFLDYVQSKDNVWLATRADIARHWHAHHTPSRQDTGALYDIDDLINPGDSAS